MKNNFSRLFRDALDASGCTQKKAAEALHVSAQTISSYLQGRSMPDIELFDTIVRMFGIDVNKVFNQPPGYRILSTIDLMNAVKDLDRYQLDLIRAVILYFHITNGER